MELMKLLTGQVYEPIKIVYIRSMNISEYKHNFKGLCENFKYPKCLSKR